MANDPAKVAAESYKKATDAYAQNQTAQGMAAAQVADKVAAPDPLDAIKKKMAASQALTPAEQKQLNDSMAKANGPIPLPAAPAPLAPSPAPLASAPVKPTPPAIPADEASRAARFKELWAKMAAGKATDAEKAEANALAKAAPEMQPGYVPLPSKEEAAKAIAAAKANGAVGYLDPEASTASLETGGPAVYRDFPTDAAPDTSAPAPTAPAPTEKKRSAVDDIIAGMKDETGKEGGPNIWDIIQAAAAGWNFQTPAYLERKKTKEAKAADIEKLSKTAQFERALQGERETAANERNAADIAARKEIARMQAGQGIGTIPGATKGQQLGAGLLQGMKGK
jgi:hypothetical protein